MKEDKAMDLINTGKVCPYCWQPTQYRDSLYVTFLNGQDLGMIYVCEKCAAYTTETFHNSRIAIGRLYSKQDQRLLQRVEELWAETASFHVLKPVQMRQEFGRRLGVEDPSNLNIHILTPKQLRIIKDMLFERIAKYVSKGREPRSRYCKTKYRNIDE